MRFCSISRLERRPPDSLGRGERGGDRDRGRCPAEPALQRRLGARARFRAEVGDGELRRAVDFDGGVHPDLHARVVADRRRHELVAGGPHDLPRQPDRARADGPQRPRRHAVRHPVPRLLPRVVRHPRRERARRCCARSWPAAGSASRPGSAARRSTRSSASSCRRWPTGAPLPVLGITLPQLVCFLLFWGVNMLVIYKGIDSIRLLLNIKAPLLIALGLALLGWAYARPAASGRSSRSRRRSTPASRRPGSSGLLLPGADRHGRLLGDALAQHPGLLPLRQTAARPGRSARRSACRRRWRSTRSSAWR